MSVDLAGVREKDPILTYRSNDAQRRLFKAIGDPKHESLTIVLMLKGNRAGGSWGMMTAWSAIMFGTAHKAFQGAPWGSAWPFRKSARLCAPIASLEDKGPLQMAMKELFPAEKYEQSKGSGHGYYSQGSSTTGWTWDAITYDQTALQASGANKGLILMSEPPPQPIFTECITRLSGNGMIIVECTRLDLAGYLDEYVEAGALVLAGKKVGEVRVVTADIEDSCREHHHGHQAHSAIEATIAAWPEEEREARRTGKSLRLSGRIYPNWSDANELVIPPDWHRDKWDEGLVRIATVLDPADRRPWAMTWFAIYPNEDVIAFQEWPPFDFQACKSSPVTDLEDYRSIILESEATIGRPVDLRFIDPLFGNTPGKGNAKTIRNMLSGPCRACMKKAGQGDYEDVNEKSAAYLLAARTCTHKLFYSNSLAYDGSVRDGHILVRQAIGNPAKGVRPKLYATEACPNFRKGMRRYAWKEEKNPQRALSEKAQLVYKDFPDLVRLGYLKNFQKWPEPAAPLPRQEGHFKARLIPKEIN